MNRSYIHATVLALAVGGWILSGQIEASDDSASANAKAADAATSPKASVPEVRVRHSVAQQRARAIVLMGRTQAVRKVEVKAETAGRIIAVPVEKGRHVAKGTVIARIAPDDRPVRLKEAESVLLQREFEYKVAKRLAEKNYRAKVKVVEANAYLSMAKASLARIKVDLSHTILYAPFSGILDKRAVEVGDYLKIGIAAASIVDLSTIKILVNVAERDVAGIVLGAPVSVRFGDDHVAQGDVSYIASTSSTSTRTFAVEVRIDNEDGRLREGLTARVVLPGQQSIAHQISPAILTLSATGEIGVKAVNDQGVVTFYAVQLISDTPEGVWLGGLPDELTLITVGQEFVRVGSKVRPVPEIDHKG